MAIEVGDRIPDFRLKDQKGEEVRVQAEAGKKRLIYFYPKNNTSRCTQQACAIRDRYDDLIDRGVEIIGISSDSVGSHEAFSKKHRLNFTLLSDPKGKIRKAFGATHFLGLIPSRTTYLIDEKGMVLYKIDAMFDVEKHLEKVMEYMEERV